MQFTNHIGLLIGNPFSVWISEDSGQSFFLDSTYIDTEYIKNISFCNDQHFYLLGKTGHLLTGNINNNLKIVEPIRQKNIQRVFIKNRVIYFKTQNRMKVEILSIDGKTIMKKYVCPPIGKVNISEHYQNKVLFIKMNNEIFKFVNLCN